MDDWKDRIILDKEGKKLAEEHNLFARCIEFSGQLSQSAKFTKRIVDRYGIVCKDIFLLGEIKKDKFKVKHVIELKNCCINTKTDAMCFDLESADKKRKFEFKVDSDVRREWINAIQRSMSEYSAPDETIPMQGETGVLVFGTIHDMALKGDMAGVQSLLDAGTWINETDEKGMTALHHCAGSGNESMLEFLLNAEADADARDWNGNTPLHFAASFGHDGICDRLVSQMPAIDARNIDNRTAYMECVRGCCNTSCTSLFDRANFWRCLRVLESHYSTKHQVRSNATARTRLEAQDGFSFMYDSSGQAAIHTAAAAGDSECLKCLLWLGASVHQQTRKADTHSDDDDDEDNRNGKGSFQKDSPPNECTALHVACMTEMMSLHAVEALLQWGANPNELDSRGMSPMACILMNAGAPPTERKRSIITLVRYGGRFTQPNPESLGDGIQPNSQFSGLLKTIKSSNQKVNLEPLLRQHEIYDEIKINRAKLFWEENGVDDIDLEDPEDWNVEVECHWLNIIGVGEGWIMNPSIVNSEEWIADAGSMRCLLCSKKFTVRFRRHHCRQCGVLCCGECSSKSHIFPQDDDEPEDDFERVMNSNKKKKKKSLSSRSLGKPKRERVCDGCFNKMQTARRIEDRKITRREECNEDTEERLEKARRVYDNETREAMDELRKMQEKTRKLDEATNELGDIATDFSDTAAMLRMHLNTKKKWYKF